jgi:hypothetical protein
MTVRYTVAITRRMRIKPRRESRKLNAFVILAGTAALAAGLASAFLVKLIGNLPLAELLFLPLMPILVFVQGRQMVRPTMRPLLLLLGVWLVGQILTDIYRETAFLNWARGDANIIFFGIDLLALTALLGRSTSRKVVYLIGYSISALLMIKLQPSNFGGMDPGWKWGWGPPITILVVLGSSFFYRRRNYAVALLFLLAIAAGNLIGNSRSRVGFLLMAATLTIPIVPERLGRLRVLPLPGTFGRVLVLSALALGAGGAALGAVELATLSGMLEHNQQEKNERQSQSPGGMLIGGRPEILVSSRAVIDSPILGHGSKPKDPKYSEMLADFQARYGLSKISPDELEEKTEGAIPSHSFLLGTWVSAGVLGVGFWIYLLSPAGKALIRLPVLSLPLAPLYAYLLTGLLWDIFFSPFAGIHRVLTAFAIVLAAEVLETREPGLATESSRGARKARHSPIAWQPADHKFGLSS